MGLYYFRGSVGPNLFVARLERDAGVRGREVDRDGQDLRFLLHLVYVGARLSDGEEVPPTSR